MATRLLVALALLLIEGPSFAARTAQPADPTTALVSRLEDASNAGNSAAIATLGVAEGTGSTLDEFARMMTPTPTRVVIKERDRTPARDGAQRLLLEVFTQRGIEARVGTWRADVGAAPGGKSGDGTGLRIVRMERLSVVTGLYRLSLDSSQQFDVHDLTVNGQDLAIKLTSGSAFVARTPDGATAVVLMGRGRLMFSPPDEAERTQVRIFAGEEALNADFECALVRVRPSDFALYFAKDSLVARAVAPADLRRAQEFFDETIGRALQIDLTDLSRDRWSLVPVSGDMIAEFRTKRFGNLTYTRVGDDAEDVSLFDRKRRKNISVYASSAKLAERGRFYSEDDLVDYDVLSYDIEAAFSPERLWIDGLAKMVVRVRAPFATTLTLRLADSLTVRGVYSPEFGRLLHLRIVGQNSIIISLPAAATRDAELPLQVLYSGRLEPQTLDREAITLQDPEPFVLQAEPRYVYSNRSYWYPQSTVTDYATAKLRITVPQEFDVVASGTPVGPPAPAPGPVESGERPRKLFVFDADRPVRYLSCVISRFSTVTTAEMRITTSDDTERGGIEHGPSEDAARDKGVSLIVQANPRQASRARGIAERSTAIFQFYASLVGEAPYPSFTLAVSESDLPGGHSPAYFALLNQTLPNSQLVWRNDPVSFESYPSFFLAHEIAHQWWGQGVGWKNYHEQWLSEGFAQYFAALYAEKERGADGFTPLARQMRKWAIDTSPQGPIYLGYRLGHIKSDGRVFRAVLYNKAAMVLHMLRRLVGDEAFFSGVRKFYMDWRFKKAGTDDFRVAMEAVCARDLKPFFEAWIYGLAIPRLRFSYEVMGDEVALKLTQRGPVAPVPVTVMLNYTNGDSDSLVIPVLEQAATRTVRLKGTLRDAQVNQDYAALAEFDK
jgi:hypothetical protein